MEMQELLILLIIVLILFGGKRLRKMPGDLRESFDAMGLQPTSLRAMTILVLTFFAVLVPLVLWVDGVLSGKRAVGVFSIFAIWLAVGYLCLGRKGGIGSE